MNQRNLFNTEPHPPFAAGSDTSHEAAHRIAPVSGMARRLVLIRYADCGPHGATRDEVSNMIPMRLATVCARTHELVRVGALEPTTELRPTSSGCLAEVLRITPAGAAMLAQSGE